MPRKDEQKLSREEIAKREIGHTEVKPKVAWLLTGAFLAMIFAVPVLQHADEICRQARTPQAYDIFRGLPRVLKAYARTDGSQLRKVLAANAACLENISRFEDELENASLLNQTLLGPTQALMIRYFNQGNEQAYVGHRGWLFFRPGFDYVAGPGFLEPQQLAERAASGNEYTSPPQPDPRLAILQFHRQLQKRGIELIIVPAPVKGMIHPEYFSSRYKPGRGIVQNPSYALFKRELEQAGVLVFDPAPRLAAAHAYSGRPQFLAADTHWTPAAMEFAAKSLADFIRKHVELAPTRVRYKQEALEVSNLGDIAAMLQLPKGQNIFTPQTVKVKQVSNARTNLLWRPQKGSEVLVLGDSFSNVYSLGGMGWGESAGLVEQLSYYLQRPLDRLGQNDAGAFTTRQILSRKLAKGDDRLAGKKLVIWEFAARELAVGDWKLLAMKLGKPTPSNFIELHSGKERLLSGMIEAMSPIPKKGSLLYRDLIIVMHLQDLKDAKNKPIQNGEALVYLWGIRDYKRTPAAGYREGQRITVRLQAWEDVEEEYGSFQSIGLDDEKLSEEEPCWGKEVR